jgi:hypothetical protein
MSNLDMSCCWTSASAMKRVVVNAMGEIRQATDDITAMLN